jgi:hypothetical protein
LAGSGSISLRSRDTWTSMARSNTSWSRPRARSISFSRASGWRGWATKTFTSENSPVVSVALLPSSAALIVSAIPSAVNKTSLIAP